MRRGKSILVFFKRFCLSYLGVHLDIFGRSLLWKKCSFVLTLMLLKPFRMGFFAKQKYFSSIYVSNRIQTSVYLTVSRCTCDDPPFVRIALLYLRLARVAPKEKLLQYSSFAADLLCRIVRSDPNEN